MIGSDLGSNCLERLSADDTNRQRVVIWELDRTLSMYGSLLLFRPVKKMLKKMPRVVHNVLYQDVCVARSMQGTKYFNIALVLQLSCRTSALQFSLILQTYALVL